jgi:Domain of unknown function, B. Theta Gene description (DUF3875)
MEKWLNDMLPAKGVEHDCILSKMGDVTVAFEVSLPEIFTLYVHYHERYKRKCPQLKPVS